MLAALQQQQQPLPSAQPTPSPVFTIALSSQDFPPPSFKRTRSISQRDDAAALHKRTTSFAQSLIAGAASSPAPPPPPRPVSAQPQSSGSSLFGDDPIFAGLLENATFASPAHQADNGAVTVGTAQATSFDTDGFLPCSFNHPPLDWSLHSRLRFTCSQPLDWCCSSALSQQQQAEAMQAFIASHCTAPSSTSPASSSPSPSSLLPAVAFASALFYYQHPASALSDRHPLSPQLLAAQSSPAPSPSEKRCLSWLSRRWAEWEQSLRSLFYALRSAHCQHFFVVSPAFTALFLAAATSAPSAASAPSAVLSRSTAAMRAALTALGVRYAMPYAKTTEAKAAVAAEAEEAAALRLPKGVRLVSAEARKEEDGSLSSLLLVTGREDVHGVFDWLLNAERKTEDVPRLLSSSPFLHATLTQLQVDRPAMHSSASRVAARHHPAASSPSPPPAFDDDITMPAAFAASSSSSSSASFSVDITGPILPLCSLSLYQAVAAASGGAEWSARLWREEEGGPGSSSSSNINSVMSVAAMGACRGWEEAAAVAVTALRDGTDGSKRRCVALCHDEQVHAALLRTMGSSELVRESPAVSGVRCINGVYSVQLKPGR